MNGNNESLRNIMESWGTGFTYKDDLLNLNNGSLNYEDYNIIYDELEKVLNEILLQLEKDVDEDDDKKNELIEQKGICLGSMAKIKLVYQKETDSKYNKLIDNCLECARLCSKDNDDCEWYKEAQELQKKIELKDNSVDDEKEIKKEVQKQIDILDNTFDCSEVRFINEVLDNFPYEGYNKYIDNFCNNDKITIEQIEILIKKYDPDKYPSNTKEEKIKYKIIVYISQKLNEIKSMIKNKI